MILVSLSLTLEYMIREESLAPAGDQCTSIKMARMEWPETHISRIIQKSYTLQVVSDYGEVL